MTTIREIEIHARNMRENIVRMLVAAGSGHPAGALGLADIYAALFFDVLHYDRDNPESPDRDILVISNGHTVPVFYAALAEIGAIPESELLTLRKFGSRLQGHPERKSLPWIETTSGPLGCGLSQVAGMAYALKYWKVSGANLTSARLSKDGERVSEKTRDDGLDERRGSNGSARGLQRFVYCMVGDGELDEGNNWEALMFAAKNRLGNLIAVIDRNHIQIDGDTEDVMPLEPLDDKFRAFGWQVIQIDGNNPESFIDACAMARAETDCPTAILAYTVPGKGVSFMENDYTWHGKTPNPEQAQKALNELEAEKL
ncbi:transketolase [Candidatus Saccharibacteria bacterium]|nr:transketolase [Candidatus Saccharibacteria bacterium]MCL1963061.1 transketolase [Candidatus Saccharibacteria bacterium]